MHSIISNNFTILIKKNIHMETNIKMEDIYSILINNNYQKLIQVYKLQIKIIKDLEIIFMIF